MSIKNLEITELGKSNEWVKGDHDRTYYNEVKVSYTRTGKGSIGEFEVNDTKTLKMFTDNNDSKAVTIISSITFASSDDKKEFLNLFFVATDALFDTEKEMVETAEEADSTVKPFVSINKTTFSNVKGFTGDVYDDARSMSDEDYEDMYDLPRDFYVY